MAESADPALNPLARTILGEDPVFGQLSYQRAGFWEGRLVLGGKEVEISVEAGEGGALHLTLIEEIAGVAR